MKRRKLHASFLIFRIVKEKTAWISKNSERVFCNKTIGLVRRVYMDNFVITIARGFGSGGRQIASQLADELSIHSYEHRILTLASQMSGYDEHYFEEADEKLDGSLWGAKLRSLPKRLSPFPNTTQFKGNQKLFDYQKKIITGLAEKESCIIVGKCADFILKDKPNVVSVYVEAPRAYCLKRVMETMDVTEEEAHRLISKTDKYRADYYKFYTGGNYWTNPVNYDITLNPDRLGQDNCIEMIKECLKLKFGAEKYEEMLEANKRRLKAEGQQTTQ